MDLAALPPATFTIVRNVSVICCWDTSSALSCVASCWSVLDGPLLAGGASVPCVRIRFGCASYIGEGHCSHLALHRTESSPCGCCRATSGWPLEPRSGSEESRLLIRMVSRCKECCLYGAARRSCTCVRAIARLWSCRHCIAVPRTVIELEANTMPVCSAAPYHACGNASYWSYILTCHSSSTHNKDRLAHTCVTEQLSKPSSWRTPVQRCTFNNV
jgi:hypothetical protein